jgi:hypothetical protein
MLFRHEPGTLPPLSSTTPAAASSTRETETAGLVVDRPPPGLARGRYAASPWAIGALGGALVVGTILYFALRFRRSRP